MLNTEKAKVQEILNLAESLFGDVYYDDNYEKYHELKQKLFLTDIGACPFCGGECYYDEEKEKHITYPLDNNCVCAKFKLEE